MSSEWIRLKKRRNVTTDRYSSISVPFNKFLLLQISDKTRDSLQLSPSLPHPATRGMIDRKTALVTCNFKVPNN